MHRNKRNGYSKMFTQECEFAEKTNKKMRMLFVLNTHKNAINKSRFDIESEKINTKIK